MFSGSDVSSKSIFLILRCLSLETIDYNDHWWSFLKSDTSLYSFSYSFNIISVQTNNRQFQNDPIETDRHISLNNKPFSRQNSDIHTIDNSLEVSSANYIHKATASLKWLITHTTHSVTLTVPWQPTGPDGTRGFQLYLEGGALHFEVHTAERRWSIDVAYTKFVDEWVNIAVAWGKSTKTLKVTWIDRRLWNL